MLAHVKTHRIKINIEGEIPKSLIKFLQKEYGNDLKVKQSKNDSLTLLEDLDWFKNLKSTLTPGDALKVYRTNNGWTQEKLGEKLKMNRHRISDLETGKRNISLAKAKKLSEIFKVSVQRFI